MREIFTELLKFLAGLLVPVLLIVVGAALAGAGFNYGLPVVGWAGAAILAAGVVWGALLVLFASGGG